MADFVFIAEHTVPAGNGAQVVSTFNDSLGLCWVEQIELTFPPGCAGLVGGRLRVGGSSVYPNQTNQYFIHDDYIVRIPVTNQVSSGQWALSAYNLDFVPHILQVSYYCNYVVYSPGQPISAPISL